MRAALGKAAAASLAVALGLAGCSHDDGDLAAFCAALDTEEALRADAPDAVRADIDVLVRFFEDLVDGLEQVEPGSDERPAIYDEIRTRFDQVEAASTRIRTYVETNC